MSGKHASSLGDRALHCDFLIAGAGAAGCVLADRLSADGRFKVILVEAGGADRHPLIHIPAGVGALIGHPRLDWGYATRPQSHAGGRSIPIPRGKVLGGCTSTNGMVYFRGHPADYDEWAENGCPGWAYADVLPYFRRSEDNAEFGGPVHGTGGPVHVSSYAQTNSLSQRFVAAGESLGFPRLEDFNEGSPEGFGIRQAMIRKGRRVSGATAFLTGARKRPNLRILTGRLVARVQFSNGRVAGVDLTAGGRHEHVVVRGEVILAAGSFGSPAILERSGIGDARVLGTLGLRPIADRRGVGRNLQDHVVAPVQMLTRSSLPYVVEPRVALRLLANICQYLLRGDGPLASNVFEATGFVRTSHAAARPDVQMIFMPMHRAPGPLPSARGYGVLVGLLRPGSRGEVHIGNLDPAAAPLIDPRFLEDVADLPPLIEGVRLARRILAAGPFSDLDSNEFLPGSEMTDNDALAEAIRRTCVTVHHPVGTCRMGNDPDAIVDPRLRVVGVTGLRVVDASIMPTIIGGNTAAPVYMIAEKAADMILAAAALA